MKQVERKKLKERPNSAHLFSCIIKGDGCKGSQKRPKHLGGGGGKKSGGLNLGW